LTVREQHIDAHEIALLPLDLDSVVVYVKEGLIPKNVRDALAKAAQLKAALLETQRQIQERMQRINEIGQEQTRIRANMGAVNSASAYSKRLLQELDDQETQIQDTRKQAVDLQKQQNQRQKELEDFLSNLECRMICSSQNISPFNSSTETTEGTEGTEEMRRGLASSREEAQSCLDQ